MRNAKQYNINFQDTKVAFRHKSDKELRRSYILLLFMSWRNLARLVMWSSSFFIKIPFVAKYIKSTLFGHFVCGETLSDVLAVSIKLANRGIYTILDHGLESQEGELFLDNARDKFIETVRSKRQNDHMIHASIKLTALFPNEVLTSYAQYLALKQFDCKELPLDPTNIADERWRVGMERISRICAIGKENGVGILFDAEESWMQAAIDYIALRMMREFNSNKQCVVYNTYQMYRVDGFSLLRKGYELMQSYSRMFGVKLVRGAYMEKERCYAKRNGLSSPIHPSKKETDACFNEGMLFCIEHISSIHLIVATHNEHSTQLAIQALSGRRILSHNGVIFSQLYGMGDHLTYNLQNYGAVVAKYIPYGKLRQVFHYLVRRAKENSSIKGHASRELKLLRNELKRRRKHHEK